MTGAFTESNLKGFNESLLFARTTGAGISEWVEHLEEYDDQHRSTFPPASASSLITSVNALPWSTLDPFSPIIEDTTSGGTPSTLTVGRRSLKWAKESTGGGGFVVGSEAYPWWLLSPGGFEPLLPVIRGTAYNGQQNYGSWSEWLWAFENTVHINTVVGKGRTKWAIDSTVFVYSFEVWALDSHGNKGWNVAGNWNSGYSFILHDNPTLVSASVSLPKGTWFEVPVPTSVIDTFANGFLGMENIPVFFESESDFETRTGMTLA